MPTVVINDPQLASYLGIEVGGLALDQRADGGGIIGLHDAPSELPTVAYTAAEATAIINSLPSLARLSSKLYILRTLMSTDGANGADYTSNPSRHPLYGALYATYLVDETQGDLIALLWPDAPALELTGILDTAGRTILDPAGRRIVDTKDG